MSKLPSLEDLNEIEKTLQPYFLALGKVAHSWNHLHEELGKVFCAVTGLDISIGMSIWHSLRSDRGQRDILQGAINSAAESSDWVENNPQALAGVNWLINEVNTLANKRNDAVHAPCYALPGEQDFVIKPITFYRNERAASLHGKNILKEFEWYERLAETLRHHAGQVRFALDAHSQWPDKPSLPKLEA